MIIPAEFRGSVVLCALLLTGGCASEPSKESARALPAAPPPARQASTETPPVVAVVTQQGDTGSAHHVVVKTPALTEAEQRVADGIVFTPRTTPRFLVAARNKRLLLDIGRVDLEMKKDAEVLALVRRVSERTGPLAHTPLVNVRGTWGQETDSIVGYDVWNGRAVAVLRTPPSTDSLLRKNAPLVGVATVPVAEGTPAADTKPIPPAPKPSSEPPCVRDSIPAALQARVAVIRDSLVRWMTDSLKSPFPRFVKETKVRGDATTGCFATWRAVVIGTSRTPSLEWNEERALLVSADGAVLPAKLRDLRLRAHESLMAFDADGDGVDELVARGLATRMGAQSVLKLEPSTRRFSRFASGFAWETR